MPCTCLVLIICCHSCFIDTKFWHLTAAAAAAAAGAEGYEVRYGMVHVDFNTQERKIKESGYWWSKHFFSQSKKLAR
jgi:beta-glucosidase/6-phospho-beta-glucosidase/beta-galactosidase